MAKNAKTMPRSKPTAILVKPEPFVVMIPRGMGDDDIQDLLEGMGFGDAAWCGVKMSSDILLKHRIVNRSRTYEP